MSDFLDAMRHYEKQRGDIHVDAYGELIELVAKHGNRVLKDKMWTLVERTRDKTQEALDELKSAPTGGAR